MSQFNKFVINGCLAAVAALGLAVPAQSQDFVWAKRMGAEASDVGLDTATDGAGNVYVTGYFNLTVDFDPGPGLAMLTSAGSRDVFVSKFDGAGNLVWARRMGGTLSEFGGNITVDAAGNVYTTGIFDGAVDFDPGPGVLNLGSPGGTGCFVSKLNSDGNLVWAKSFAGSAYAQGNGIAVDGNGNVYTTGVIEGPGDFDPGPGSDVLASFGDEDIFVWKLNSGGNYVWAKRIGGPGDDIGGELALDGSGNVYITGAFAGTVDFNPNASFANHTSAGGQDAFVLKLASGGNFAWARRFGALAADFGQGVEIDGAGNVLTTGSFHGTVDFDPGAGISNLAAVGSEDIFISKLDSNGAFVWARRIGGTDIEYGASVAIDSSNNVYTTGLFRGTVDFDPGANATNITSAGEDEIFISKLDSAGNFVWARRMGGVSDEFGQGVAVGGGHVYVTGRFRETGDYDPGAGMTNLTSAGNNDGFLAKLTTGSPGGAPPVIGIGGIVLANLLPKVSTVSPRSIISVFGENFSSETIYYPNLDPQGKIATILGGTCLLMNGQPLPIFAMTPGQINAQIPATAALGPMSFTVVSDCVTTQALSSAPMVIEGPAPREATSAAEMATVEEATPAFFIFDPVVNGYIAARFNDTAAAVAPAGLFNDEFGPSRPAKPGDIIVLYGTGWGDTAAHLATGELATEAADVLPEASHKITLGGIQLDAADVFYVGVTPQTAGLYQAAIKIPANATPGNSQVVLTVYGKSTPVGPVIPIAAP